MKKIILALIAFAIVSCEKDNTSQKTDTNVLSQLKSGHLVSASNKMTFQLLTQVDSSAAGHNFFISPYSVQQALSMTLNGAKNETYNEMEKALGFEGEGLNKINDYNQSLINALVKADPKVTFQIANSIWALIGYPIEQPFFDVNKQYYTADVKMEDFSNPEVLGKINKWCEDKTQGKVKEVLDNIDPNAMMYLINALYFKGSWKYEFDKKNTTQKIFYKNNEIEVMHEQMVMEATIDFYEEQDFSMVALPYGDGSFRMIILLPVAGKTTGDIIASMNADSWKNVVGKLKPQKMVVKIPKFKFEFKSLLNNNLIALGMKKAFQENADFTGISKPGGIWISRVIHKTFVEVNEEGSEAAAVTVVEAVFKSDTQTNAIPTFVANKPFIYFIEEKSTGALIFSGIMNDPNEEKFELK